MDAKLKSEIKKLTYAEVGGKLDDMREANERDIFRYEGAITALKEATGRTADLCAHVDKDFDSGAIKAEMSANEVRALIKRWLMRASGVCENLKDGAVTRQLQSTGKVASLEQSIAFVKTLFDTEDKKAEALAALQTGDIPTLTGALSPEDGANVVPIDRPRRRARLEGTHPGDSIAAQRKAQQVLHTETLAKTQESDTEATKPEESEQVTEQNTNAPCMEPSEGADAPAAEPADEPEPIDALVERAPIDEFIAKPTLPAFGKLPTPQLAASPEEVHAQVKKTRAKKSGRKAKA
jgi:hypothetical protein